MNSFTKRTIIHSSFFFLYLMACMGFGYLFPHRLGFWPFIGGLMVLYASYWYGNVALTKWLNRKFPN